MTLDFDEHFYDEDSERASDRMSVSDTESEDTEEDDNSFCKDLREWGLNAEAASYTDITNLLTVLNKHGWPGIPHDARTLSKITRNVAVEEKGGGSYLYLGIEKGAHNLISKFPQIFEKEIDFFKIFRWGIILSFFNHANVAYIVSHHEISTICCSIFYGPCKPKIDEYLNDLCMYRAKTS